MSNPTTQTIAPIANDIPTGTPITLNPKGNRIKLNPTTLALFSTMNTR